MAGDKMERVTRSRPCPIRGKSDWCLVASDGSTAICARIADGSVKKCSDAGYLHILEDRHNGHNRHRCGAKWRHSLTVKHSQENRTRDFDRMSARHQSQLTDARLHALAGSLGVSAGSLQRLRTGWDGRAYAFPMSDASGRVIGIRRRFVNGGKASVKGSRTGLSIPLDLTGVGPLLLCEGPTDTGAALDLGFDALGRPSCNSLVEMTVRAVRGRDEIVVVADSDVVGQMGAERLANVLVLCYPSVRVVHPPDGVKDLRQWFSRGLTRDQLCAIINDTSAVAMTIGPSLSRGREGGQ